MESVKTIIISGGGGDLGQSVARWWAKPEARLVLLDRDAERLEKFRAKGAAYAQHNSATVQPTAVSGKEAGISTSPEAWLPAQEEPGLTLDQYATAKKLLIDFLNPQDLILGRCSGRAARWDVGGQPFRPPSSTCPSESVRRRFDQGFWRRPAASGIKSG